MVAAALFVSATRVAPLCGTKGYVGDRFSTIRTTSPDRIKDLYLCLCGASPQKDLNAIGSHWLDLGNLSDPVAPTRSF